MRTSGRLAFHHWSRSVSVTDRIAVYGPVRTVMWQGSAGDRRPHADQCPISFRNLAKCLALLQRIERDSVRTTVAAPQAKDFQFFTRYAAVRQASACAVSVELRAPLVPITEAPRIPRLGI